MFIIAIIVLLITAFILALWSLKNLNQKPGIKAIKKSLDKNRVVFHSRASST